MSMFCYQCQEAAKGTGCTSKVGTCGVTSEVIHLQDLCVYLLKGNALYAERLNELGKRNNKFDHFLAEVLFSTITNVNFTETFFMERIKAIFVLRTELKNSIIELKGSFSDINQEYAIWEAKNELDIITKAAEINGEIDAPNEDIRSLRALILYGLKGMAAYADHAKVLGKENPEIYAFASRALAALTNDNLSVEENIALVMETGKYGVSVMALLDEANTTAYGNPEITKVNIGVSNKPGILISGHDLKDMEELLKQTDGTGVDVYTHSEMLPAHYYPAFKKYSHFVGNYGGAWWQQKEDFESFNGPVLFTTNCIVPPSSSSTYSNRVFTTGVAGFPAFKHIENATEGKSKDFSSIIELAKTCKSPTEIETGEIIGGFAHAQVFALADKVVEAVKSGAVKKFFVMAGCDGRMKDRNYYTEFAEKLPKDTIILTAGCAKYRYNKLPLGDIGGIPRVLDAGQCNDSYSLAVIALKLKEVFELNDINDLPIAYNIAWYEQKAVIVLLALLHLGVKNIHLGPSLPAFLSPNVAKVLIDTFGIAGIGTVDEDMKIFLN
ncbi:MAG: hydroxylamine reductase [Bacteroidetes bacterium]|nr:hydroxylamine reductase [Bacteroidota bacterium]